MSFQEALERILIFEGGYSNNPRDPGGKTRYGVTQAVYDDYRESIDLDERSVVLITDDEMTAIYRTRYWLSAKCNIIEGAGKSKLALVAFDWAVNAGVSRSLYYTQAAFNTVPDGIWGEKTLDALAEKPEGPALNKYLRLRALHYRARAGQLTALDQLAKFIPQKMLPKPSSDQIVFLEGWLARLRACSRATGAPIDPLFAKGSHLSHL